ncbi:MAG: NfeD family protein, partial [Acidimicrobiales bacterium]
DASRVGSEEAIALGLVDSDAATLGDFVLAIIDEGILDESLAVVVTTGDEPRRELVAAVRFHKIPLFKGFLHSVASPQIAYLMLLAGLGLLLLEFFTAGVGIAGLTGVSALLLSAYGLGVLPINSWALVLLILATIAFGVDIQAGVPRLWTGVGTVLLLVGSFNLFDGVGNSWITLLAGLTGFLLSVLVAIPSLVRSRFSTTTIGREWMIGEMGEAISDVSPSGMVRVQDALWKATTNRATPISTGEAVRVVGIDGVFLEIEPETGGARDYREMRKHSS